MELSRPEYWSGLPFASPGDLPNPGIEPRSPALQADSLPSEPPGNLYNVYINTGAAVVNNDAKGKSAVAEGKGSVQTTAVCITEVK